jgi:hypothetical protein
MPNDENATQTSIESASSDSANKTASARLSAHELNQLDAIAKRSNTTVSSLIRELILAKIESEKGPPKADILLTEIVDIRLMLRNLLVPIAIGSEPMTQQRADVILAEIKKLKNKVALELQNGETRK